MSYSACDVAEYIIYYSHSIGESVSNMKLQKLLYFVQGEFLKSGKECFLEEIEAWDYGPVVHEVYNKYKVYSGGNIPYIVAKNTDTISEEDKMIIQEIVSRYKNYGTYDLVRIALNQDSWKNFHVKNRVNTISKKTIREYFSKNLAIS